MPLYFRLNHNWVLLYAAALEGRERDFSARGEALGRLLHCHLLPSYPDMTASSICLLRWMCSSVLISSGVFVRGVNRSCRRPALYWLLKSGRLSKLGLWFVSWCLHVGASASFPELAACILLY
ncbi:hypothetical protein Tco_0445332 [Tanacetum coccineum]